MVYFGEFQTLHLSTAKVLPIIICTSAVMQSLGFLLKGMKEMQFLFLLLFSIDIFIRNENMISEEHKTKKTHLK